MTDLTLHLTIASAPGAPRVAVSVATDITAAALRRQASDATKIPLATLKLIFRGKMVKDDFVGPAVPEYKLEDGSVLHCMGKPVTAAAATATTPAVTAAALPSVNLLPPGMASAVAAPTAMTSSAAAGVDPLVAALQTLRARNAPAVYQTAVETLAKLLAKITAHPTEAKYRTIKKANPAFGRKLGSLPGGHDTMTAAGFVLPSDEDATQVYELSASADAWPKLLAAQTTLGRAVTEAQVVPTAAPAGGGFGAGGFPGMGGAGGLPPGAASLLSDPAMMQSMLQNPMVQNMMRTDPRFANNPAAQQMMQQMASNPAMLQQMAQMMQNPAMRQQMEALQQNPAMLQQMQSLMGGGAAPGGGGGLPLMGGGSAPSGGGSITSASSQPSAAAHPPPSDQDSTEEEMIAEAIRRSLQDNNNNN